MATKVERFQSDAGGLFETEFDALRDDLKAKVCKIVENEPLAKKLADALSEDFPSFYYLIARMEQVLPTGIGAPGLPPPPAPIDTLPQMKAYYFEDLPL